MRFAFVEGKIPPPVIDLVINRDTANILNSDDMMRTINPPQNRKKKSRISFRKAAKTTNQINVDPLIGDGPPVKSVTGERPQKHPEHCVCCFCSKNASKSKQNHPRSCTCCICRYGCRYGAKPRLIEKPKEESEKVAGETAPPISEPLEKTPLKTAKPPDKQAVPKKTDEKPKGKTAKRKEDSPAKANMDSKAKEKDKKTKEKTVVKPKRKQVEKGKGDGKSKGKDVAKEKKDGKGKGDGEPKGKADAKSTAEPSNESPDSDAPFLPQMNYVIGELDAAVPGVMKVARRTSKLANTAAHATAKNVTILAKRIIDRPPCFCGIKICEKEAKKIRSTEGRFRWSRPAKTPPPCVCGSKTCKKAYERKEPYFKQQRKLLKKKKKLQKKEAKRTLKGRKKRLKQYTLEDAEMYYRNRIMNKKEIKEVRKYRDAHDLLLLADSAVDITKLGVSTAQRVFTILKRAIRFPGDVKYKRDVLRANPKRAAKEAEERHKGSNYRATAKRVKCRCSSMQTSKYLVSSLEKSPITNYMLHLRDKDPQRRLMKIRQEKDPLDFECSLYMGSLRKRPCLWVYFLCPWFYPHCLSILSLWRQFTDVILFVLAVGVWSPCILCTEFCRAVMCCFMCAGG